MPSLDDQKRELRARVRAGIPKPGSPEFVAASVSAQERLLANALQKYVIENTRLGALELRRTLHCLDVKISLGELALLGDEALAVGARVEQHRCEAFGAARQSAHELDELW